jgi:predicted transcriptional regulator
VLAAHGRRPTSWRTLAAFGILAAMARTSSAALAHDLEHNPVLAALRAAPLAEDDLSPEERAGLEEGMADIRAGRTVPHAEVQAEVERAVRAMARFGAAADGEAITLGIYSRR